VQLLYPAFQIQHQIIKVILNESWLRKKQASAWCGGGAVPHL
jgi:hypothetical protein